MNLWNPIFRMGRKLGVLFVLFCCICKASFASSGDPFLPNSVLSLDDVVAVALLHQPDLKAARDNVKAALSRGGQATAAYWPEIDLDSNYYRGNFLSFPGPVSQIITENFLTYETYLSSNLTIEDFGKRHAQVGKANAQIAGAEAQYHDTRSKVIFNAAEAYFKVLQAQALTEVNRNLETASLKRLDQAKGFVATGEKPKLELLKAQAAYLSDHFNYLKSEEDLANAHTHLDAVMGINNPPSYTVKENFAIPPFQIDLPSAKAFAFKSKPELRQAQARVEETEADVNALKAGRWPIVQASALYGWADSKFPPGSQSWLLGATLHWPLFDGNKLTHQINEAVAFHAQAEEQEKTVRLQVDEDIEKSYRVFQDAQTRLLVARQEAAQAQEANRLADARYKVGLAEFIEVADAHAQLATAKAHEVEALTDLRLSQSALKRSIGLEEP